MLNTLEEIIREMEEKPDAHMLVEWIDRQVAPGFPIGQAIAAYFDALER